MIFDEAGEPRVVPPAAGGHRGGQPAGAAARRQAGADLVAGLHPAAGLRRGRRDDRRQLLPPDRPRARGQRLQSGPARIPHHPAGHGAVHGLQPDRLQPLDARRPPRRRGHRQPDAGNRPAHGARAHASGTASTTCALSRLLQHGRDQRARGWPFDYFHLNSIDQLGDGTDADLGAQHVGAVRTEHARPARCSRGSAASTRTSSSARRHTAYQHDAERAPQRRRSACSTTAPCRRSTRSRAR